MLRRTMKKLLSILIRAPEHRRVIQEAWRHLGMAREARRRSGKSVTRQYQEMLRLHRGFGKLLPSDYFMYRMYDDQLHDSKEKQRYLGSAQHMAVNNLLDE